MLIAISSLLVAMASIQGGASLAKSLFPRIGPEGATLLRIGLAAALLSAIFRPWRKPLAPGSLLPLLAYGGSLGAMNLTFYLALERIPLGIAVALEFTGPLAVAFLASRRWPDLLWATLALCGILMIAPHTAGPAALDPAGISFALGAGAFWALYIIFGRRAGSAVSGAQASALGMIVAALVALPFGVVDAGARLLDLSLLPLALAVAILSSALPYSLEMISLRRLPPQTFGILMSLEPAIAAISGLAFLDERLSAIQWLAIALIVTASAGSAASSKA